MKKIIKILKTTLIIFALFYVLACYALYSFPYLFLFYPASEAPDVKIAHESGYPAEVITYKTIDGTDAYGWYSKPDNFNGKVIIFMHGNAFGLNFFHEKLIPLHNAGYATFMPEFRGFGGVHMKDGNISNKTLADDAVYAVKELYKRGYSNEDIIVYGMSLGSHMATSAVYNLKSEGKFDALVLEVPFNRVPDVAKEVFPVYMPFDLLIRDKFDNEALIPFVNTRVLIMAANKDKIVPYKLALKLFEHAVEPKDLIVYDGYGHNNLLHAKNYIGIINWLENK